MKDEIIFTPFYSSFLGFCKRDGISPTEAAKKAGISSGAPTAWKRRGAVPRPEQLKKLCAVFSATENEMLGYSDPKEKPPAQGGGLTDKQRELIRLYDSAPAELQAAAVAVLKSSEAARKALDGEAKEK